MANGPMFKWDVIQKIWPIVALAGFYIYLAFHALSGNQGLMRWVDYEQKIEQKSLQLEQLVAKREALEARADALRSDQLDLDALDIRAREVLFVSRPEEVTIWLDPEP